MYTNKNEKKKGGPTAIAVAIVIAIWIAVTGCASASQPYSVTHSQPAVAEKVLASLPTAKDIAAKYHGTHFHAGHLGPVPTYGGQTSTGSFFVGNKFYTVNTFTTAKAMNAWLEQWKPDTYGLATQWKGETWIVLTGTATS